MTEYKSDDAHLELVGPHRSVVEMHQAADAKVLELSRSGWDVQHVNLFEDTVHSGAQWYASLLVVRR